MGARPSDATASRAAVILIAVAATAVAGALATAAAQAAAPAPVVEVLGVQLERPADTAPPDHFTLAELADGTVTPERYDAFWSAQVTAIDAAPCPVAAPSGATTVATFAAGATPPPHLAERYTDWTPHLAAARERQAGRCVPSEAS